MSGWLRKLEWATPRTWGSFAILLLSAAGAYRGWQLHWFLTDDAFIAFRFIDSRHQGWGYTWNPPPFLPVEGYTSFGWVVLLDAIWTLFGVEPPDAANAVSLACSLGTLGVTAWACARLGEGHGVQHASLTLMAAVLAATVSQRTFLVWASGGLETALFNLLLASWVLCAMFAKHFSALPLATLAAALALTRPEGLLAVAATIATLGAAVALRELPFRRALTRGSPLLLVVLHLLGRRVFYGEWLPNTYYAKVVEPWPGAGLRYAAAFVIEYAYVVALPVWAWAAWCWARRCRLQASTVAQALALATLLAKLGFDVTVAGGDHFEYRAFSHLVPLFALAFVRGCLGFGLGARACAAALLAFSVISAVLPWTIYARDADRYQWPAPPSPPLAARVAWPFRPAAIELDALEAWLVPRGVGVRHHEHRAYWLHQIRTFPSRSDGARLCAREEHPVAAMATIGVGGWVLRGCTILDLRGLADYVIARMPAKVGYLGHDRRPPPDYVRRLMPNVFVNAGRIVVLPRPRPLREDDIRDTERYYRSLVREGL